MKQNLNLTSSPIKSLLLKIAIPSMTGSLFQTLFNIVDIFYAGKISSDALAALAKAFPLYFIVISAGIGIVAGCNSLIANAIGSRNSLLASIYSYHSILYAIFLSIFITFVGVFFSEYLLNLEKSQQGHMNVNYNFLVKLYSELNADQKLKFNKSLQVSNNISKVV